MSSVRTGTVLHGRYRLTRHIGEGGMGDVYAAEHLKLGKQVAVKLLNERLARDPDQRRRFRDEAHVMAGIVHQHVVSVTDIDDVDGVPFFVMEHLEGEDLATTLERERRLPWRRAREIGLQLCDALAATHANKIVHRDLKPSNCFLVARLGGEDFIKVLDFGIAKRLDVEPGRRGDSLERVDSRRWRNTATGEVFGTMAYMAPEHFFEEGVDHRVDVYAVGVILYEVLTGQTPLQTDHVGRFVDELRYLIPPAPSKVAADAGIPADMDYLVLRALAKRPEDRFASMTEFAAALAEAREDRAVAPLRLPPKPVAPKPAPQAAADETGEAATIVWRPGDALPGMPGAARRRWLVPALVCALVGLLSAAGVVLLHAPDAGWIDAESLVAVGPVPTPVPVTIPAAAPIGPMTVVSAIDPPARPGASEDVATGRGHSSRVCTPLTSAEKSRLVAPAGAGVAVCKGSLPNVPVMLRLTIDGGQVTGKPLPTTTGKLRDMARCIAKRVGEKVKPTGRLADCRATFVHDF